MRAPRHAVPLAIFLVVAALLWRGLALESRAGPAPQLNQPLPAFALPRLHAPSMLLTREDLRGRAWVLNVWASWCATCLEEHALWVEVSRTHAVPLIGLNYKDRREDALDWLQRHGDPYRASVIDAQGRVGLDLGVYGVPETFVIDRDGVVRFRHVGAVTDEVLRTRLLPLLESLHE